MPLNALEFLPFLAITLVIVRVAPARWRWFVLLLASLIFYSSLKVPYLPAVLLLVVTITYFFGRWIHDAKSPTSRWRLLAAGVVTNVLILIAMRYIPFILEGISGLLDLFAIDASLPIMPVLVAIGVSYFVFQAISYLADIYLERLAPERHLGNFALHLSFFPKLLQGPIERGGDLLPQLRENVGIEYENLRSGMLLFAWGLFKKAVIADRLGLYVDACYGDVHSFTGTSLILATYLYGFQLYLDFSGYTDMAIGSARLFNIRLSPNFRDPYHARTIVDFWRRWHITLSTWILDYIFRPLQIRWRNRGTPGTAAALFVTFVICGLWHGPTLGFLVFGALHGIYMASSAIYTPWEKRFLKARQIRKGWVIRAAEVFLTFNLVSLSWVFFRASDIKDAWYVVTHAFRGLETSIEALVLSQGRPELVLTIVLCSVTLLAAYNIERARSLFTTSTLFRWAVYYTLVVVILAFGRLGESEFLYFRF